MCSLQITPACNMPLMSIKNGGKVAIVNLQVRATEYTNILLFHVCLKVWTKDALTCTTISIFQACNTYDLRKFCYEQVKNILTISYLCSFSKLNHFKNLKCSLFGSSIRPS